MEDALNRSGANLRCLNMAALRRMCLERLRGEPGAYFSREEMGVIRRKLAHASRRSLNRGQVRDIECGLRILTRDLFEQDVSPPKWALLFAWLAPESAAAHCPHLVAELAWLSLVNDLAAPSLLTRRKWSRFRRLLPAG
jgi:hypothetical protein